MLLDEMEANLLMNMWALRVVDTQSLLHLLVNSEYSRQDRLFSIDLTNTYDLFLTDEVRFSETTRSR